MRLFIAIDLSKEAKQELKRLQQELFDDNIKVSAAKSFHLTLRFLGDVEKPDKIIEALKKVEFSPTKLKLSELGVFPNKNYVRVVWVGIEENKKILELHKQIQEALKPFNFKEDFDFKPHLTLGRVKFVRDKSEFIRKLESIKVESAESDVKEFILYKSTLTPDGPFYEKLL
ncbi:RNA 2',3'-cyclic phosphodiesterase [Candidatus Woesearchaeota archaeon]|nr:RNA 2',3'-cyclic phosphodiesterase [Candidatus Woesearchaeota archaeon]